MSEPGQPPQPAGPSNLKQRTAAPASARRSSRRRAREYALQGLYQWLVAGGSEGDIAEHVASDEHFSRADAEYFRSLLARTIAEAHSLNALVSEEIDRPLRELAPVEHAILLLATHELRGQPEIPCRVIVNEAIELAKSFGGTDGYKYVNGVLDRIARRLRAAELA
jgi:transcription antitermination protein NusB